MKHTYKPLAAVPLTLLYLLVAWSVPSSAQESATMVAQNSAPRTLSYQGVLTHTGCPYMDDTNPAGTRLLTLTLYGDANGRSILWQTSEYVMIDSFGVFNCTLGTGDSPLPEPSAMDRPLWLGVAVDNGPELRPLSQVTASAYALNVVDNAITTNKLADNAVTSAKLADSSVTASKLNFDYIPSITVDGIPPTKNGVPLNIESGNGIELAWLNDSNTILISGTETGSQLTPVVSGDPSGTNTDDGTTYGVPGNPNSYNFVGGGQSNAAWPKTKGLAPQTNGWDVVAGGLRNKSWGNIDAIAGGDTNIISGDTSFIVGGEHNLVRSNFSGIGGGESNVIDTLENYAFLGGGYTNQDTSSYTVLGGGSTNKIQAKAPYSVLGGGRINIITTWDTASVLVGGDSNFMYSRYGFLGGGYGNTVSANGHDADDAYSAIVGGSGNFSDEYYAFIGGGQGNQVVGLHYGTIAGGDSNQVGQSAGQPWEPVGFDFGFVGGGRKNNADQEKSAIVGGDSNVIANSDDWPDSCSFIGGGESNSIGEGTANTIAGGWFNFVEKSFNAGHFSTIGGGLLNGIQSSGATIAGGDTNQISYAADYAFIGGGGANSIRYNSIYATISGGLLNLIDTSNPYAAIGGGEDNDVIPHNGPYATIPGGDSLIANSFAQTVIGYNNMESTTVVVQGTSPTYSFPSNTAVEQPLFIIGNGTAKTRSDAFEVSYDGHSKVTDQYGNESLTKIRAPIFGGTYDDNIVYAWGDVQPTLGPGPGVKFPPVHDFGVDPVAQIAHPSVGIYIVTLNTSGHNFTEASVTATPENNDTSGTGGGPIPPAAPPCMEITCSEIGIPGPNQFVVRTYLDCAVTDEPFFFKVCGR